MTHLPANESGSVASASLTANRLPARDAGAHPITQVSLAFIDQRLNVYLRFGRPYREVRLDRRQRRALFLPGALFARVLWQANDYGTTRWQVMVLHACKPFDPMQRIQGVSPGARILLHVEGERRARIVLTQIDIIEALGIDPADASPAYWLTLGNRTAAGQSPPSYSAERHAAWLAARACV